MSGRPWRDLLPRHLYTLVVVLILAAVSAQRIDRAPEPYVESATVVLAAPNVSSINSPYSTVSASLVTTSAVVVESLNGSYAQGLVRQAGGTTDFNLALVNLYNEDYPDYSYPLATLTAQATDRVAAHRTFTAVLTVLQRLLAERQTGAPPLGRISIHVVGDTGPFIQRGSLKRSLAALGLLTAITVAILCGLLDRHRDQLAIRLLRHRQHSRVAGQSAG